jgi:hypothetical protein
MAYRSMVSGYCFASSGRLNRPFPLAGGVNAATALPAGHRAFVSRYSVREHPDFLPITYTDVGGNEASWNGNARKQKGKISRKWTRMDANLMG